MKNLNNYHLKENKEQLIKIINYYKLKIKGLISSMKFNFLNFIGGVWILVLLIIK